MWVKGGTLPLGGGEVRRPVDWNLYIYMIIYVYRHTYTCTTTSMTCALLQGPSHVTASKLPCDGPRASGA